MALNPTHMLPELDLCADGQCPAAETERLRSEAAKNPALGRELLALERLQDLLITARVEVQEGFGESLAKALGAQNSEHEGFAQWLSSERIAVRDGFADDVALAARAETEVEGSVAALLSAEQVEVRNDFAQGVLAAVAAERDADCPLAAALARERVDVRADFTDRVMASVADSTHGERPVLGEASPSAATASRWTFFGAAAAILLMLGSMALLGSTGESGLGIVGMLGDFASMTLLAGAGMLGATWAGVGSTVDAWLGSSIANWAVALMLVAGLAFLCQRTVRRARVAIRRD